MVITNPNNGVSGVNGNVSNPVQYPQGFSGADQKNANMNVNAYGDDTNTADYGSVGYGGANQKYQGEGTKNTNVNYNPDLKTGDLDPNYAYGGDAIAANSAEAGYIMNRNDNIASALYNEGITTVEGVRAFLDTQKGFTNSTAEMQDNTTQSIYKRIGDIQQSQQPEELTKEAPVEEEGERPEYGAEDPSEQTGVIYGRETGKQAQGGSLSHGEITEVDPYGAMQLTYNARKKSYESLQMMDPYNVAVSIANGYTPYGENAMRDLQKYDPERYSKIQEYVRELNAENTINSIANGEHGAATNFTKTVEDTIINDIESRSNNNADKAREKAQNTDDIIQSLKSNESAKTAYEEMSNIQRDIARLNNQLENLPQEAKSAFKGDVPAYLYDCYVSNQTQKIQNELSKLESRYNAAADMYKTELANYQWEQEFSLKKRQMEINLNNEAFDRYIKEQQLEQSRIHVSLDSKGNAIAYRVNEDGTVSKLDDTTAYNEYQSKVSGLLDFVKTQNGKVYGQCEDYTDDLAEKAAGVRMVGKDGRAWTTVDEKVAYATNPYVSDTIPVVGDVAVFDYGIIQSDGNNYGHTMYVTGVNRDENGDLRLIMSDSNGKKNDQGKYDGTVRTDVVMSLKDFYNSGKGKGFWNPYKQAQYDALMAGGGTYVDYATPMDAKIDNFINGLTKDLTQSQQDSIARGSMLWNTAYNMIESGRYTALVESGTISKILTAAQEKMTGLVKASGKDGNTSIGDELFKTFSAYLLEEANTRLEGDQVALQAFQDYMILIEQKLRDESGAAISSGEWQKDFFEYLPQAGDDATTIDHKLENLNEYIKKTLRSGGMGYKKSDYIDIWGNQKPVVNTNKGGETIKAFGSFPTMNIPTIKKSNRSID